MTDTYKDIPLINNTDKGRFEMAVEGHLSIVEYKQVDDKIYVLHTEVPKELEGKGVASALTEQVFTYIEQSRMKLVPYCPYTVAYLKRHPDWKRILVEGGEKYLA